MKRILSALIALLFLSSQVLASNWLINSYRFAVAAAPTLTFLQCATPEQLTGPVLTFTAQNVGPANVDRTTIVGVGSKDGSSVYTVTGITVGGDIAAKAIDYGGAGSFGSAAIFYLHNPVGTSESVVVTFDEAITGASICLWSINQRVRPLSTASNGNTSSAALTLDLATTSATGFAIGICISTASSAEAATWTGLTEQSEVDIGGSVISAAQDDSTSGSSLTITCDFTGSAINVGAVSASFEPGIAPRISFIAGTTDPTDTDVFTFTSHATGPADITRKTIVAGCGGDSATDFSITSIAVAGSTGATEIIDSANASSDTQCAIWLFDNPTGTTATITLTFTEAIAKGSIGVWAAYDLTSSTATDIATAWNSSAASISGALDIQANGIAIGACATRGVSQTTVWTGLTEQADISESESSFSYADTIESSAQIPFAVTCDYSGSSDVIITTASFQ